MLEAYIKAFPGLVLVTNDPLALSIRQDIMTIHGAITRYWRDSTALHLFTVIGLFA